MTLFLSDLGGLASEKLHVSSYAFLGVGGRGGALADQGTRGQGCRVEASQGRSSQLGDTGGSDPPLSSRGWYRPLAQRRCPISGICVASRYS